MHMCTCILSANSVQFLNPVLCSPMSVRCTGGYRGDVLILERVEEGIQGLESVMNSDIQVD